MNNSKSVTRVLLFIAFVFFVTCAESRSIVSTSPSNHAVVSYNFLRIIDLANFVCIKNYCSRFSKETLNIGLFYHSPKHRNSDDEYPRIQYSLNSNIVCKNQKLVKGENSLSDGTQKDKFVDWDNHQSFMLQVLAIISFATICLFILIVIRKNKEIIKYKQLVDKSEAFLAESEKEKKNIKNQFARCVENSQQLLMIINNQMRRLHLLLELASVNERKPEKFYGLFRKHMIITSKSNLEFSKDIIAIANISGNGIIDYLNRINPTLSQYELCYCSLICLGYTPESIRVLYNHSNAYSIYMMRYKIRNKLGISGQSINLESYLQRIKSEVDNEDYYINY